MSWFVTGRKYRKLQAANSVLWRQITEAQRELTKLELDSTIEDWERGGYTLAHRIRIRTAELKYQPMADAEGKTYTWVCSNDELGGRLVPWPLEIVHGPTSFHQHSVTPRVREETV